MHLPSSKKTDSFIKFIYFLSEIFTKFKQKKKNIPPENGFLCRREAKTRHMLKENL